MPNETFPRKWWALVGLGLLSFTAFLDFTIVTTALPFIQKDLNASVLQLQWVMTIFAMILCMFMIIAGKAGDMLGSKKVFYFGFIIFAIAAIGSGSSPTIGWLIFFRAIQGFAAAIIATVGVSLLPLAFPAKEQTRAIGIYSAFNGAGLAIGPFLGGLLITMFNWRAVFWVNIPIIVVGMLFSFFALKPEPKRGKQERIDWVGLFLLVVGLGSLVYGIVQIEQSGWRDSLTKITLAIGVIASILLVLVETRVKHPLLDFKIFKNKHVALAMVVCVAAGLMTYSFMFFDPLYLALMRHQTAFLVGISLLCVPVIQVLISVLLDKLVKRFGIFNLLLFGVVAALISALCHAFFMPNTPIWFVLLGLALMGYTWGIANAGTITALSESVPPEKMGVSMGTIFTFWNVSGSVFLALTTVIFHWQEGRAMEASLAKNNVQLTSDQHHQVMLMLSDPNSAFSVLKSFIGVNVNEVLQAFYASFMSGFHYVAWFAVIVLLVILAIGLKLR